MDNTSHREKPTTTVEDRTMKPSVAAELFNTGDKENDSILKRRLIKLGVVAAAAFASIGVIAFGVNNGADKTPANNLPPAPDPAGSSEIATPVEADPTKFEVIGLPSVSELEISAEQPDEKIAEDIMSTFSSWGMSGANRDMLKLQSVGENSYLSLPEFTDKVQEISDPVFEEVLFGENANNPDFQDAIAAQVLRHEKILMAHYQTYGPQNSAPYFQNENFQSLDIVNKNTDGTTTYIITTMREDNADKNIIGASGNGHKSRGTFVGANVNGKTKIVQPPTFTPLD